MRKMYLYNISYFHSTGNGSCQMTRKKKINSLKEFNEVRTQIEEKNNLKTVAIINFQLICKCSLDRILRERLKE